MLFLNLFSECWKSLKKTRFPAISRSSGLRRSGTICSNAIRAHMDLYQPTLSPNTFLEPVVWVFLICDTKSCFFFFKIATSSERNNHGQIRMSIIKQTHSFTFFLESKHRKQLLLQKTKGLRYYIQLVVCLFEVLLRK